MSESKGKTSTGMEQNLAGLLCYVLGWITGIIFLLLEKDNRFVRFHAIQSIVVFGAFTVLEIILSFIPVDRLDFNLAPRPTGIYPVDCADGTGLRRKDVQTAGRRGHRGKKQQNLSR